jgi:glycosyltransferase involved in cell wall biosynthesis
MRRVARVVAVAEVLRREVIAVFRVPEERVVTIPNGVDPRRLEPDRGRAETRKALGIPLEAPVILSLGALTWEKDPLAHLDVARRVHRERPETVHLLVGDGPLREEVAAAIERAGLRGRVLMTGARGDVPDLLAATDLLLLASRTEGAPGCLIEAGMAGVPVVAYGIGGVPEVVEDGVTGWLAPPGDVARLTVGVIGLLTDPGERERMSSVARERSRVFDIKAIATMYLNLYKELATPEGDGG